MNTENTICVRWSGFHTCDGPAYRRNGITLCAAHYRAQYSVRDMIDGVNSSDYRVTVGVGA